MTRSGVAQRRRLQQGGDSNNLLQLIPHVATCVARGGHRHQRLRLPDGSAEPADLLWPIPRLERETRIFSGGLKMISHDLPGLGFESYAYCAPYKASVSTARCLLPRQFPRAFAAPTRQAPSRMTESLRIHPLSAAHTPGDEGEGVLSKGAHVAGVEEHAQRFAVGIRSGSRRPVEGRLHVGKGMASRERRAGERYTRVRQARQLLERGKPPAQAVTGAHARTARGYEVASIAVELCLPPSEYRSARRLLPD